MKLIKDMTNEELVNELVYECDTTSQINESNYILDLKEEVLHRMSNGMANNKFDLTTPTDCSNAFGCPHFINGKPSF